MSGAAGMDLVETAVARLCHDLSSSLGAVMNALELAGGDDALAAEALVLAQEASREVSARLRLARALWAGADGASTAELVGLLAGLANFSRLTLDTARLAEAPIAGRVKQLVLAVMMVAADSLCGPGGIVLAGDPAAEMVVMLKGKRAAWPAGFAAAMAQPAPDWTAIGPRALMPALVGVLARAAGARVSVMLASGDAAGPAPLLISVAPPVG